MNPKRYWSKTQSMKERRTMIVEKVKEAEEERRRVKMTGLSKQGAQTRWEVPEREISQRKLITTQENQFRFLVKAVYDLLLAPRNKKT